MISRAVALLSLAAALALSLPSLAQVEPDSSEAPGGRVGEGTALRTEQLQQGPESGRPAWKWTNEERISERLNPHWQEQRRQRANAKGGVLPEGVTVINGSLEPELFFPEELFRVFVAEVLADDPDVRLAWRTDIANSYSGRLTEDFWVAFESVAGDLKKALQRERQIGRDAARADDTERDRAQLRLDRVHAQRCDVFKETLAKSRALLPAGEFDRLLYEGVAPSLKIQEDTSSTSLLRRLERGC